MVLTYLAKPNFARIAIYFSLNFLGCFTDILGGGVTPTPHTPLRRKVVFGVFFVCLFVFHFRRFDYVVL